MANNNLRKRRRWIVAGVAFIVLIGCGFGIAAALRPNRQIDASKLATVERGDLARSVVATGKIEPLAKVEVKSKASGIVEKIFADYGDRVKQGQVLVELDKEQLRAQVAEACANLQAAEAAVQSAQATFERNVVDAQGPDLPFLKSTAERNRKMAAEGLISASLLDDGEKAYQMALNKQLSAQRGVAVSRAEVAHAKAQVAQMQAALENAEEDLRNSTIVSPMDGLVLSRDVQVGGRHQFNSDPGVAGDERHDVGRCE
jgi:HlyD family secretion protein